VERTAVLPVTEPALIAQIHRDADVLTEEYTYTDEKDGAAPQAIARIQYRSSQKYDQRLAERIEALDFGHTKREESDSEPVAARADGIPS
jgi:GTP-binding protein HflX